MTKLLYLDDTYLFEAEASFVEVRENERGTAVILDETIFYPQGGGQPADHGTIMSEHGLFRVTDVRLNGDGTVWHFGAFEKGEFSSGEKVQLKIDKDRRMLHARLHTAGHLLDDAFTKMGMTQLVPTKGFHFSEGPYVEYDGVIENPEEVAIELERVVNLLAADNFVVETQHLSAEEAEKQGVWAPPGKSARLVGFRGLSSCGCGGTHVTSTKEIGRISVKKIKCRKGVTRVSYQVCRDILLEV